MRPSATAMRTVLIRVATPVAVGGRGSSAPCPVSVEEDVVQRRPAQARRRRPAIALVAEVAHDVDELLGAPPAAATVTRRSCSSTVRRPAPAARAARPRSAGVADDDLDPLAADLALQLVGGAAGDDPALIDDGDRRRPARRPPPGTGSSAAPSRPPRPGRRMTSHMARRLRGSSPVVGSSRKSSRGWPISALARSRRRRMPPEYVLETRSAASSRSKRPSSSSARRRDSPPEPAGTGGRTSTGSRVRSGSRRPRRTGPRGRSAAHALRVAADVEAADAGAAGVGPKERRQNPHTSSSCRRRSARAVPSTVPLQRSGRRRPARAPRRLP